MKLLFTLLIYILLIATITGVLPFMLFILVYKYVIARVILVVILLSLSFKLIKEA